MAHAGDLHNRLRLQSKGLRHVGRHAGRRSRTELLGGLGGIRAIGAEEDGGAIYGVPVLPAGKACPLCACTQKGVQVWDH